MRLVYNSFLRLNGLVSTLFLLTALTSARAQALPEMIFVKGGEFTMEPSEGKRNDNMISFSVTVSDFSIAKTETTLEQWKAYCRANNLPVPETKLDDTYPITGVTWEEATAYKYNRIW